MCTVTLIPTGENDFILTSNRDEAPNRNTLAPEFYTINNMRLLFPKDELAGGSWIGVTEKQRVLCVLNGAFEAHERKANYRMSRGVVMKDLLVADNLEIAVTDYDLTDIEPFTLVIAEWNHSLRFMELIWDGKNKHFNELPIETKIWSSSSLYNQDMKQERLKWFNDFRKNKSLVSESILKFHKTAGAGNLDYGVIMDRYFVKTTSITQIEKRNNVVSMNFENLQEGTNSVQLFEYPLVLNE